MKEWAAARQRVQDMKSTDQKAADKLNKEITIRYRTQPSLVLPFVFFFVRLSVLFLSFFRYFFLSVGVARRPTRTRGFGVEREPLWGVARRIRNGDALHFSLFRRLRAGGGLGALSGVRAIHETQSGN